jgi:hypothetical protein
MAATLSPAASGRGVSPYDRRGQALDTAVWTAGREVEQSWRERFDAEQWTTLNDVLDRLIEPQPG